MSFREEGPAFERAKAVAGSLNMSIQDYLLSCIAEGYKLCGCGPARL